MRRGDKTNPVDSLVEDGSDPADYFVKVRMMNRAVRTVVADLVILAIDALKVAVVEKNIAYPIGAADGRFLAPVDADAGNVEGCIAFAIACFSGQPVGMAVPWAQRAIFKFIQRGDKGIKIQGRGRFFRYFWQLKCKTTDK